MSQETTMTEEKIIYTPQGQFVAGQEGCFVKVLAMATEALRGRELIWRLFLRNFHGRYRQSVLGIAWAILLPFATVGVFVLMNRSGLVKINDVGVPYPLYALIGLAYWSLLSTGLTACASSLIDAGSMLTKINFPRSSLVFAAGAQGVVEFSIRSMLTAGVFLWYGTTPNWGGLAVGLICVVPLCLLMLGIGFIVAILGGLFRDVINALNATLAGLLILTPILYRLVPNHRLP
jgi:lipopolysaccharide transport system permease protein